MKLLSSAKLLILLLCISIASCKKDEDPSLTGIWNVDKIDFKEYNNNQLVNSGSTPGNGATFEFKRNGEAILTDEFGDTIITTYSINGNTVTLDDFNSFEMSNLTNSSVTLFNNFMWNPGQYDETYVYLKR